MSFNFTFWDLLELIGGVIIAIIGIFKVTKNKNINYDKNIAQKELCKKQQDHLRWLYNSGYFILAEKFMSMSDLTKKYSENKQQFEGIFNGLSVEDHANYCKIYNMSAYIFDKKSNEYVHDLMADRTSAEKPQRLTVEQYDQYKLLKDLDRFIKAYEFLERATGLNKKQINKAVLEMQTNNIAALYKIK